MLLLQGNSWSTVEAYWVYSHLWDGVAFYHSLLHSLAAHASWADFLPHQNNGKRKYPSLPIITYALLSLESFPWL